MHPTLLCSPRSRSRPPACASSTTRLRRCHSTPALPSALAGLGMATTQLTGWPVSQASPPSSAGKSIHVSKCCWRIQARALAVLRVPTCTGHPPGASTAAAGRLALTSRATRQLGDALARSMAAWRRAAQSPLLVWTRTRCWRLWPASRRRRRPLVTRPSLHRRPTPAHCLRPPRPTRSAGTHTEAPVWLSRHTPSVRRRPAAHGEPPQ
mmetsp:Transcript_18520/g.60663  ORF Transcript_18520/g.60663 Transcript_18520/m.60663 type:complete len:209 (-) Transcript_18520:369-995(-)